MIDFYTWAAPNGLRVAIMLVECGLQHRTHLVDLGAGEHRTPAFLQLNPAGAIPVIVDHDAPGGPLTLTQSGAILVHLARRTGRFLPADPVGEARTLEALMLVMTDIAAAAVSGFLLTRLATPQAQAGEMFRGRLQAFLRLAEDRLASADYLAGDYSIADMALFTVARLPIAQQAIDAAGGGYERLLAWRERVGARPAVQAALTPSSAQGRP